ncbi:MAG: metallophosphoesterase family protein [Candidatus Heimdallarchaeota archaeon]
MGRPKKSNSIQLSEEDTKLVELIREVSFRYANLIERYLMNKIKFKNNKQKRQKRFIKKTNRRKQKDGSMRLQHMSSLLGQAIVRGIPLREPPRRKRSRGEPKNLLIDVEDKLVNTKEFLKFVTENDLIKKESRVSLNLDLLKFIPKKIYLQRIDDDNSKLLVKLYVDWGYTYKNQLPLFLDDNDEELAHCVLRLMDLNEHTLDVFQMHPRSKLIEDNEKTAHSLFIGHITKLESHTRYKYRIECYRKTDGKLFAFSEATEFKTSFNIKERNSPLFLTVNSDLHGGRKAAFMRGKVNGKIVLGNIDLKRVFTGIAETEQVATFGKGYSLTVATGDVTQNASYSEYWADLFDNCTQLWNHVPLLTTIGNHDYYTGGTGKGIFLGGPEEDCRYWHKFVTNPDSKNGNLPGHWYSIDQGNAHCVFLDSNGLSWGKYKLNCKSEQWQWLNNNLKEWRTRLNRGEKVPQFCFVFMHSAIMSLGFWGRGFNRGNDERVQSYVLPLFRKYGVDMVFSGHDHIYQRSKWFDTTFMQNGRYGGMARPAFYWLKNRTTYDIERVSQERRLRVYNCIYVPPNQETFTSEEENDFNKFLKKVEKELLEQPTSTFFFFGLRYMNHMLGRLFDRSNKSFKKQLIRNFVLPKLRDHIWLRAYALEKIGNPSNREIYDMAFIKKKDYTRYPDSDYEIQCPQKVVE